MKAKITHLLTPLLLCFLCAQLPAQTAPELASWMLNTNGTQGQAYTQGNFTPANSGILADVQQVQYSATNVYITANGIPSYPIGPYLDGNPSTAGGQSYLFRIPRSPQENTGTKTGVGLGHIGVLINGVPIYNSEDARSYSNQGIWHQVAPVVENDGFDCSKGHPAPRMGGALNEGYYHHHQSPHPFNTATNPTSTICDNYPSSGLYTLDANQHSPLLGYAFDGFPIYGSYGYTNPNGTGPLKLLQSSYQLRNISNRQTLPDGTVLNPNQYGPAIGGQYPLGYYVEDYEFVANSGDLDEHNGRFTVTPEYPNGIYCYYATVDNNYNSVYPFFIGPEYYGIVATDNFPTPGPNGSATNVVINEPVQTYDPNLVGLLKPLDGVISTFPNPANEQLKVDVGGGLVGNFTGEVTTLTGQKVLSFQLIEGQSSSLLDVSDLKSGVYFSSLSDGISRHTSRIVIAH